MPRTRASCGASIEDVVVRPHQAVRVDLPSVPSVATPYEAVLRLAVGVVLESTSPPVPRAYTW